MVKFSILDKNLELWQSKKSIFVKHLSNLSFDEIFRSMNKILQISAPQILVQTAGRIKNP